MPLFGDVLCEAVFGALLGELQLSIPSRFRCFVQRGDQNLCLRARRTNSW
jgi:hypothetical protein